MEKKVLQKNFNSGHVKLALTLLADSDYGQLGGVPLTMVATMHNTRLQPSSIHSRGCDISKLWWQSVFWLIAMLLFEWAKC